MISVIDESGLEKDHVIAVALLFVSVALLIGGIYFTWVQLQRDCDTVIAATWHC